MENLKSRGVYSRHFDPIHRSVSKLPQYQNVKPVQIGSKNDTFFLYFRMIIF